MKTPLLRKAATAAVFLAAISLLAQRPCSVQAEGEVQAGGAAAEADLGTWVPPFEPASAEALTGIQDYLRDSSDGEILLEKDPELYVLLEMNPASDADRRLLTGMGLSFPSPNKDSYGFYLFQNFPSAKMKIAPVINDRSRQILAAAADGKITRKKLDAAYYALRAFRKWPETREGEAAVEKAADAARQKGMKSFARKTAASLLASLPAEARNTAPGDAVVIGGHSERDTRLLAEGFASKLMNPGGPLDITNAQIRKETIQEILAERDDALQSEVVDRLIARLDSSNAKQRRLILGDLLEPLGKEAKPRIAILLIRALDKRTKKIYKSAAWALSRYTPEEIEAIRAIGARNPSGRVKDAAIAAIEDSLSSAHDNTTAGFNYHHFKEDFEKAVHDISVTRQLSQMFSIPAPGAAAIENVQTTGRVRKLVVPLMLINGLGAMGLGISDVNRSNGDLVLLAIGLVLGVVGFLVVRTVISPLLRRLR